MKITCTQLLLTILLFAVTYAKGVKGQGVLDRRVDLALQNSSLEEVLKVLEKKTKIKFVYSKTTVNTSEKVSVSANALELKSVLNDLFAPKGIIYEVFKDRIVLNIEKEKNNRAFKVTGKVSDSTGTALPGTSVTVKGATGGAVTNSNGEYAITTPDEKSILVFSNVGYITREVSVAGQAVLNVTLFESKNQLNDVVVVGYGTQRKADVTGAIASVGSSVIARSATPDATGALQGQIPGAVVVKNVGKPGSGYSINIRGISSFGGTNSPLFVIDGIPSTSGINDLNPADIESIDVLKDASATAIYGSRGGKGVVIVTTKRGKAGKTVISYDAYAGVRTPTNLPDLMNADEFIAYRKQQGVTIAPTGVDTDWPSLILKNGLQMNHNVTVSGGDEKTRFAFGGGFLREQGNVSPEDFKRYSFRGNIDRDINDKWKAGLSVYLAQNLRNDGSYETLRSSYRMPPMLNPYDSDGNPIFRVNGNDFVTSPLFDGANDLRESRAVRVFGNLYLQVKPIANLTIKTTFSPSYNPVRTAAFLSPESKEGFGSGGYTRATNGTSDNFIWLWDNQATYERQFGVHKFTLTAIQSMQKDRFESNTISVFGLPFRSLWHNVGSASNTETSGRFVGPTVGSAFTQFSLSSARVRLNYGFKDKYLFTASGTWDGSSRLAEGNKWGFFPSASFAWRLSEESFIKKIEAIDNLKLRLSYGESGNDRISAYSTQATLTQSSYYFGNNLAPGYTPGQLANKDLTWESTSEVNIGLDFGMFNNRISGTVDVYNRKITNLLGSRNLPAPSGWSSVAANIGKLKNRGVEIGLSIMNIKAGKFSWKSDFVFDANRNEVLETTNGKVDDLGAVLFIGQPAQVNFDYVFDGIWQSDQTAEAAKYNQTPGQVRVKDIDNNGVINAADRQIIGKRVPNWTGSFGNTFRYGNLDLYVLAYTRQGEQFLSNYHQSFMNYTQPYNQARGNYWTPDNPSQTIHKPSNGGNFLSASYYKSADFVRISNITLGYTIPNEMLRKVKINNLRLYATATNPFLFSDYKGYDPEWAAQNTFGTAVSSASFIFGLNLGF